MVLHPKTLIFLFGSECRCDWRPLARQRSPPWSQHRSLCKGQGGVYRRPEWKSAKFSILWTKPEPGVYYKSLLMMADFVTPRHSAVMERLRRRIELFRQHHNSCESRYENATLERLELERQQTFALHQRCLQAKAKRSNKHRQPQPSGDQSGQRAPGSGGGGGGGSGEHGESGGTAAEQSRNSTLIAVSEHWTQADTN